MADDGLPIDRGARALLLERIQSFEGLEVLMLLHAHREQAWSADEVAAKVGIRPADAEAALQAMADRDLLERLPADPKRFRYNHNEGVLGESVESLAAAYETSRLGILKMMSADAIERVRSDAARLLADGFLLGRKKDG